MSYCEMPWGIFLLLLLYNKVHCYYLNLFAILAKGTVQYN